MKTAVLKVQPMLADVDLDAVVAIERLSFDAPWRAEDFQRFFRPLTRLGMVALGGRRSIAGYALVEAHAKKLQLVRIAVHPKQWGRGVGRKLLRYVKSMLRDGGRTRILAEVDERNVHAQLFLKHCGFQAVGAIEAFFGDGVGAIQFEFRLQPRDPHLDFFCFRRARQM